MALGDGQVGAQKRDFQLQVGNTVLYNKFGLGVTDVEIQGVEHMLIKEDDCIGTMPRSGATADDIPELRPLGDRILIKVGCLSCLLPCQQFWQCKESAFCMLDCQWGSFRRATHWHGLLIVVEGYDAGSWPRFIVHLQLHSEACLRLSRSRRLQTSQQVVLYCPSLREKSR